MATPHVPVPRSLRLEPALAPVIGYLAQHDPDLRIRKSVETPTFYVLERRCRRRPAVNTGMRDRSDMHIQARDGYIHVTTVHANWLTKPWNIIRALKEEGADLFAEGGAEKVSDELDYEAQWAKETRRRRRAGLFRDIAGDHFDLLNRIGNGDGTERTRISVNGTRDARKPARPAGRQPNARTHAHYLGGTRP